MPKQDLNISENVFSNQSPKPKADRQVKVSKNLNGQAQSKAKFPERPLTIGNNKNNEPAIKPRKNLGQRSVSGSKGKSSNDPKVAGTNLKRSRSQSPVAKAPQKNPQVKAKDKLTETVRAKVLKKPPKKQKRENWQEEYLKGSKVYRLTAFTTIDNIEKKFKSNRRQVRLQKVLVSLILIFFLFTLIGKFVNFDDLNLWKLLGN